MTDIFDMIITGIMIWAAVHIVGRILHWFLEVYRHNQNRREYNRALTMGYEIQNLKNEIDKKFVVVDIERNNDQLYAYNNSTKTFLYQGKTLDELKTGIEERFPGVHLMLTEKSENLFKSDLAKLRSRKDTQE
jgi:hypothetical protein